LRSGRLDWRALMVTLVSPALVHADAKARTAPLTVRKSCVAALIRASARDAAGIGTAACPGAKPAGG